MNHQAGVLFIESSCTCGVVVHFRLASLLGASERQTSHVLTTLSRIGHRYFQSLLTCLHHVDKFDLLTSCKQSMRSHER